MTQDTRKICVDCKHFIPPDPTSVWAKPEPLFLRMTSWMPRHPMDGVITSQWDVGHNPGCGMSKNIITGENAGQTAFWMRKFGQCGEDGRFYEPTTTQQGEP